MLHLQPPELHPLPCNLLADHLQGLVGNPALTEPDTPTVYADNCSIFLAEIERVVVMNFDVASNAVLVIDYLNLKWKGLHPGLHLALIAIGSELGHPHLNDHLASLGLEELPGLGPVKLVSGN